MNRADFKQLAQLRLMEAEALYAQNFWGGAYYLAGYAIECALKACIAKLTQAEDFPPPDTTTGYYTHALPKLLLTARLDSVLKAATDQKVNPTADLELGRNWDTVKGWSEKARYDRTKSQSDARGLLDAINEKDHGVLEWIKLHW